MKEQPAQKDDGDDPLIPVPREWAKNAYIDRERYERMYAQSLRDPEGFWAEQASQFAWRTSWDKVKETSFFISPHKEARSADRASLEPAPCEGQTARSGGVYIKWFQGGRLNITENCLDRHLPRRARQTAYIWEGDDPAESKHVTYQELFEQVCRLANVLKKHGVGKGDRVTIYLPMIPEAAVAMLACARIGAIHSVVFGGFSADALRGRIEDCGSALVITADEGLRGGKRVPLKQNVDEALASLSSPLEGGGREGGGRKNTDSAPTPTLPLKGEGVRKVIVVKRTGSDVPWQPGRDVWYHEEMEAASAECPAEIMDAEDPLFILYTSGSTGKPKGVLHTSGGYMVWAGITHKLTFDYHEGDIFWCTADVGWITGHTYLVYGPLLNGATSVLYEGVPHHPDWGRFWQVIDKHKVTIFHTAPTAIRALMREGDAPVKKASRASLRLLGSVGEPINPEAWRWYWRVVGEERCPIVDTWWQTETGGNTIAPLPGATGMKPGSAAWPFFGIRPVIVDQIGTPIEGACEGLLCLADSWPGQMRTVFNNHKRFEETYFSQYPGYYFTGDGARRDEDGYYWITGRADDVLKVSGHRIGTADVESALVGHDHVTEAAVVGFPHEIKGQGIYCYVTLEAGVAPSDAIERDLVQWVRRKLGPIATPDVIHFTDALPKTRSGKIMRRILRKIAEGDTSNLGDISTLTNPEIVETLIRSKKQPQKV